MEPKYEPNDICCIQYRDEADQASFEGERLYHGQDQAALRLLVLLDAAACAQPLARSGPCSQASGNGPSIGHQGAPQWCSFPRPDAQLDTAGKQGQADRSVQAPRPRCPLTVTWSQQLCHCRCEACSHDGGQQRPQNSHEGWPALCQQVQQFLAATRLCLLGVSLSRSALFWKLSLQWLRCAGPRLQLVARQRLTRSQTLCSACAVRGMEKSNCAQAWGPVWDFAAGGQTSSACSIVFRCIPLLAVGPMYSTHCCSRLMCPGTRQAWLHQHALGRVCMNRSILSVTWSTPAATCESKIRVRASMRECAARELLLIEHPVLRWGCRWPAAPDRRARWQWRSQQSSAGRRRQSCGCLPGWLMTGLASGLCTWELVVRFATLCRAQMAAAVLCKTDKLGTLPCLAHTAASTRALSWVLSVMLDRSAGEKKVGSEGEKKVWSGKLAARGSESARKRGVECTFGHPLLTCAVILHALPVPWCSNCGRLPRDGS